MYRIEVLLAISCISLCAGSLPFSPAMAAGEEAAVVVTDAATCRRLVARAGVAPADHQPGVDVHGRAVVPADLPPSGGGSPGLANDIAVDLRMTLSELLGSRTPARLGQSVTHVGKLTIDPASGRTLINGEPLSGRVTDVDDAMLKACRAFLAQPAKSR